MRWTVSGIVTPLFLLSYSTEDSFAQAKLSWLRLNRHGDSSDGILDPSSSDNASVGEAVGHSSSDGKDENIDPVAVLEEDIDVLTVLAEEGSSCTDGCRSSGLNCSEESLAIGEEYVFGTMSAFEEVLTAVGISCKKMVRGGTRRTAPYIQMPSGICHLNRRRGRQSCDASYQRQRRLCSCFKPEPVEPEPSEPCTTVELTDVTTNFGEVDGLELQARHRVNMSMTAEQCSEMLGTKQGDGTTNYVTYSATEGCRTYLDFHISSKALHADTSVSKAWACPRGSSDINALSAVLDGSCINSGIQPGGPICFNNMEDIQDAMNKLNGSDAVIALCRSTPHPTFALNSTLSVPAGTSVRLCYAGMEGHATFDPSGLKVGMPLIGAMASPASFILDRLWLIGGSPNVLIHANANATIRNSILESGQGFRLNNFGEVPVGGNLVATDPSTLNLGKLVLEDTTIRNGFSSTRGAGVYIQDFGSVEVARCSIYGNEVFAPYSARGAGLAAINVDLVSISDSSISNNTAESTSRGYNSALGGGIFIESWNQVIKVTSTTFENNTIMSSYHAGGAAGCLQAMSSQVHLSGNIGEGNTAKLFVDEDCDVGSECNCDGIFSKITEWKRRDLVRLREGCGGDPGSPYNRNRRVSACSGSDCPSVCHGCYNVSDELNLDSENGWA